MSKIFDIDSPFMRALTRVADLMILNFLMLLCCIPVITAGAGFTGMHYVLLKMVRNEEGYIARGFFKSFKENFKQATIIWLVILVFACIFLGDWVIFNHSSIEFPKALIVVLMALFMTAYMVACYVFAVLARFTNTVFHTFKNALFMALLSFPRTVLILAAHVAPVVLMYYVPRAFPLVLMFGFSVPAYLSAMLYSATFRKFEPPEEPLTDEFSVDMGVMGMTGTDTKEDGGYAGEKSED